MWTRGKNSGSALCWQGRPSCGSSRASSCRAGRRTADLLVKMRIDGRRQELTGTGGDRNCSRLGPLELVVAGCCTGRRCCPISKAWSHTAATSPSPSLALPTLPSPHTEAHLESLLTAYCSLPFTTLPHTRAPPSFLTSTLILGHIPPTITWCWTHAMG